MTLFQIPSVGAPRIDTSQPPAFRLTIPDVFFLQLLRTDVEMLHKVDDEIFAVAKRVDVYRLLDQYSTVVAAWAKPGFERQLASAVEPFLTTFQSWWRSRSKVVE